MVILIFGWRRRVVLSLALLLPLGLKNGFSTQNGVSFLWKFASISQTKSSGKRDSPVSTAQRKSHVPPSLHLQALLKLMHKEITGDVKNKYESIWRLSKLGVSVDKDPGKDFPGVSDGLLEQIAKVLEFPGSFDAADGGLHGGSEIF